MQIVETRESVMTPNDEDPENLEQRIQSLRSLAKRCMYDEERRLFTGLADFYMKLLADLRVCEKKPSVH